MPKKRHQPIEAYPEFVLMPDPDRVEELRNDSGET